MAKDPYMPKGTLPLVAAMVGFSLIVVAVATAMDGPQRTTGVPDDATRTAVLSFADRPDGAIVVSGEAGDTVLAPETNGFVRGIMRALARERRTNAMGPDEPFVLAEDARGHLTLTDLATGARIDLRAFGSDNARTFAAFMPPPDPGVRPVARALQSE